MRLLNKDFHVKYYRVINEGPLHPSALASWLLPETTSWCCLSALIDSSISDFVAGGDRSSAQLQLVVLDCILFALSLLSDVVMMVFYLLSKESVTFKQTFYLL